jgi:hypothetical protein
MKRFQIFAICLGIVAATVSCGGNGGGSGKKPAPVIIAINGGLAGSGTIGSLFILDGTDFQTLSSTKDGYTVDFRDATTDDIVASATIDYGAGDWNDAYIKGTVPNGLTSSTTYHLTVTTKGGTSDAVDFLVVASVAFSPSTINWSTAPTLPTAVQGAASVVSKTVLNDVITSYLYVLGGNTASSTTPGGGSDNVDAVSMSRMDNATGGLAVPWTPTTMLPAKRGFAAAVYADPYNSFVGDNGQVYVLGGLDENGEATDTVYHAAVMDDGSLDVWSTTTALPQALFAHQAVVLRGKIYVAGGNDTDGNPATTVYAAPLNSDGSVGAWDLLSELPTAVAYHRMVTVAGALYVIGGNKDAVDPLANGGGSRTDRIEYAFVDLSDGTLVGGAWTENPGGIGKTRDKFTAVAAGSYIVVTGGLYNGQPGSSESTYGPINSDGSVGSFNGATGSNTIDAIGGYDPYNHATAYFVDENGIPHVIVLGGADATTGDPVDDVIVSVFQ